MKIKILLIFALFILAGCASEPSDNNVNVYHKITERYSVDEVVNKLTQSVQVEADQHGKSWLHGIDLYYTDNLPVPDLVKLKGAVEDQLNIKVKSIPVKTKDENVIEFLWSVDINDKKYDNCEDWEIGEFSHYFADSDDFERFSKSSGCELIKFMADNDS